MNTAAPPPSRRPLEWWIRGLIALWLVQAALWIIPQFRPGKLGVVCWLFGLDFVLWPGFSFVILIWGLIASIRRRPFWSRRRAAGFVAALALAASPAAFRTYPSSHDRYRTQVHFRVPLDGPVTVGWGGPTPDVNYHVSAPAQRWAYDLTVTRQRKRFQGTGKSPRDYYCYGRDVLAPADGVVQFVHNGDADMPIGPPHNALNPCGNHIVLRVAPGEFLFLCHLQPNSIRVKRNQQVVAGQILARVGNTGNTSEPHLHIHLQDSANLILGEGIPLYFYHYRAAGRLVESGIPRGGLVHGELGNEIVEHVPAAGKGS